MIRHTRDVSLIAREASLIARFRIPLTKDDQLIDPDSPALPCPASSCRVSRIHPLMVGSWARVNAGSSPKGPYTWQVSTCFSCGGFILEITTR